MSGAKSGHNAPKDVRTTQRDARDVVGRSDAQEFDMNSKEGDPGQCEVKSVRAKDVREYSVKSYSSYSRKQQGKSGNKFAARGRTSSESRLTTSSKGKIWEPERGRGRGSGPPSRRQSYGSPRMPVTASEADVAPSHGAMVHRALTHTGGVLHVTHTAWQPQRAISEGSTNRRVVESGEGENDCRLSELEERLSGSLARWNGQPDNFGRVQDIW